MKTATSNISSMRAALKVTKVHYKKKANPDAEDVTEEVTKGKTVCNHRTWS